MGLIIDPISSLIIARDRHAYYFSILAIIAGSIERVATEIRNLQKTEVQEVEEFFDKKQKGSSAMPHKKNPILSENLTGLTRMVRSYVIPALENISLWHERDISHSSVERNIGPDSTITLDFALHRLKNILKNMNVYPKKNVREPQNYKWPDIITKSNVGINKKWIFSGKSLYHCPKTCSKLMEEQYASIRKSS
jgi:adenylosuccinate lyase